MRAALPAKSPTVVFTCASAMRPDGGTRRMLPDAPAARSRFRRAARRPRPMTALPRLALAVSAAALACARGAPAAPEVRVHVSADLPGDVLAHVAAHAGV